VPHYLGVTAETSRAATRSTDPLAATLARFLRNGDDAAMGEIVAATRRRLLAAARRIGDPRDAEDAVQGAYLALVRHRGEEMTAPVFPWLLTATLRIAYRRKALARREEHLAARLARETQWDRGRLADAMPADEAALVRRAVATLPARYRDVVVLHYLQGLSTAEAALLLDVADATVRKRLQRARTLLRTGRLARFAPLVVAAAWLADRWGGAPGGLRTAVLTGGAMKTSTAVVGFLVAALLGVGIGVATTQRGGTPAPSDDETPAELANLRRELDASRAQTRAAEERAARLQRARGVPFERDAAESPAPATAGEAASSAAAPASKGSAPPVASGRYDEVLGRVDWSVAGRHYHEMLTLIAAAGRAVETGSPPDPRTDQKIDEHAVGLLTALSAFSDQVPGGGASKVFTHPAFLANALAAALQTAGMPLSDEQRAGLERLASQYLTDDAARLARYDAGTLELRKVVDEGDLRARFAASALDLLTPAQRDFVSPPAFRDRLDGEFVSASLFWRDHAAELRFSDAASFAERATDELAKAFELRDDQRPGLRTAVDRWTASLPAAWFEGEDDVLSIRGRTRTSVTADLARREVEFLAGLPAALGLDAAEAERVRAFAGTWRLVRGRTK
jgi:RNA polymerase sigma factor (sigma-70 family)